MNFAAERQAIVARLLANWATTPVRLENQPANPADNLSNGYVALYIRSGEGRQVTLGVNPGLIFAGAILLHIFTPRTALNGDLTARGYADSLSTIFRLQQFQVTYLGQPSGALACGVPSDIQGPMDDHEWYRWTLSCPYFRQLAHTT